ncbi:uncharacterized protein TNIN_490081 [Trichonephila inaurata madagascariensis]|uniref:Mutator-like transposase domain-containing protein n=1 Tax=Trichonephila inaurata madagascariensis TaxID=2747483 RepID=A0A8X6IJZ7_9ARAC|nr:uncharacterized protein TNIN_490081 [Trichonephila inaurata madagascariensis]
MRTAQFPQNRLAAPSSRQDQKKSQGSSWPTAEGILLILIRFKEDVLKISSKFVGKHNEDLLDTANGVIDIVVSYDRTWQKRGHWSLYGIGIVIDILSGLILDYEIVSQYCQECTTANRDLGEKSAE